jgi:uncharacterized protein YpuA (DUF1002 family)
MKIPRSVKISSHRIKVKIRKKVTGEMADTFGFANLTHNEIVLRSHLGGKPVPESVKAETFLHEIIHHVSSNYGISLTEKEVQQLGTTLLQVIRNNKLNFLSTEE